jgi:hypothetical protein
LGSTPTMIAAAGPPLNHAGRLGGPASPKVPSRRGRPGRLPGGPPGHPAPRRTAGPGVGKGVRPCGTERPVWRPGAFGRWRQVRTTPTRCRVRRPVGGNSPGSLARGWSRATWPSSPLVALTAAGPEGAKPGEDTGP